MLPDTLLQRPKSENFFIDRNDELSKWKKKKRGLKEKSKGLRMTRIGCGVVEFKTVKQVCSMNFCCRMYVFTPRIRNDGLFC